MGLKPIILVPDSLTMTWAQGRLWLATCVVVGLGVAAAFWLAAFGADAAACAWVLPCAGDLLGGGSKAWVPGWAWTSLSRSSRRQLESIMPSLNWPCSPFKPFSAAVKRC